MKYNTIKQFINLLKKIYKIQIPRRSAGLTLVRSNDLNWVIPQTTNRPIDNSSNKAYNQKLKFLSSLVLRLFSLKVFILFSG